MTSNHQQMKERRQYWATKMDEAYAFMEKMRQQETSECGERLTSLESAVDDAGVEVAFSTAEHVDGLPRLYFLRDGLIQSFIEAAKVMNKRGWIMRVEDGFRNRQMQTRIATSENVFRQVLDRCKWELEGESPCPEFISKRLAALIAFCPAVGTHMSGSAIDISVLDRSSGDEIDRGGPYLELSENTPMTSPFISDQARRNRDAITTVMREHGFIAYPWEFWHYNSGDVYAAYLTDGQQACKYGPIDWDKDTGEVTPIMAPKEMLNSMETIQALIKNSA